MRKSIILRCVLFLFLIYACDSNEIIEEDNTIATLKMEILLEGSINLINYQNMNMTVNGNYAYVSFNNGGEPHLSTTRGGFLIIDKSNISNMTISYTLDLTGQFYQPWDIGYSNDYVYLANDVNGLVCYNVFDKSNAIYSNTYNCFSTGIIIKENYLYTNTANNSGLLMLDVSEPPQMKFVGQGNTFGGNGKIIVKDNYAFIINTIEDLNSENHIALRIFDISDINNPVIIGEYDNSYWINSFFVKDNIVFLGSIDNGVEIIDISEMNKPVFLNQITGFTGPIFISNFNDLLFIGSNEGLYIYNISDLTNPVKYAHYFISNGSFIVDEQYIYQISTGFNILSYK